MALNKIAKYLLHSVAVNKLPSVKQHFPLITPFRKYFLRILFKAGKYEPNKEQGVISRVHFHRSEGFYGFFCNRYGLYRDLRVYRQRGFRIR